MKHKDEISPKEINLIYDKYQMGIGMDIRQRKCKTLSRDELISRHYYGPQAVRGLAATKMNIYIGSISSGSLSVNMTQRRKH